MSPRKLHSMLVALAVAIEDFDFTGIPRAKRRAKISQSELVRAVKSLADSLQELLKNLENNR